MPLRGSVPKKEEQRLKVFLYGPPNGGKTISALQFPNAYVIDTAKETARYSELIRKRNSLVFNCSDFFEIKKEIIALRTEPHRFQTCIIDELSTPYQKLQKYWLDRFVAALESKRSKKGNPEENLLEDFGQRFWDKVKRDWKDLIDEIRQLDMNVIVTAHEKPRYGLSQNLIGVKSDSDRDDEYVWDFVFRIIKRGDIATAITEKQRNLPKDEFPNALSFPPEFSWSYKAIVKFYEREYIERPTVYSAMDNTSSQAADTSGATATEGKDNSIPTNLIPNNDLAEQKETIVPPEDKKKDKLSPNLQKIKDLIVENGIPANNFRKFLRETCKWTEAKSFTSLTEKHQGILINNWPRVYAKFKESQNAELESESGAQSTPTDDNNPKLDPEIVTDQNGKIREDQINELIKRLESKGMPLQRFMEGFYIKNLEELRSIPQEGAANILKNFDSITGAFKK